MSSPYEYIGRTPVTKGSKVDVVHPYDPDSEWVEECKVDAVLATQFTVIDSEMRTVFFFYSDEGVTWQLAKQTSQE
jgi:hypothetical protein